MFAANRGAQRARPFAPWRIVVWMVMLLAAGGFVVNAYTAVIVAQLLHEAPPEAVSNGPDPHVALAWAVGYSLAAFLVMVVSLSTLRWMGWARDAMRVLALLLLVWAAYTGYVMFGQWEQIGAVLSQPDLPADLVHGAQRQRTIMLVVILLKAVSVPLLAWLGWALGTARVRQQFASLTL